MRAPDFHKLNHGLSRIVNIRQYPVVKKPFVSRRTKGRVFRVGVLHRKELSEAALLRNRRGYINAQVNTVAHAPSLYHWLFHRCGIPFAETQEYVRSGGLRVDGAVITKMSDLESQLDWSTFQQLDIQVRSSLPALLAEGGAEATERAAESSNSTAASSARPENQGPWVPTLKRALHRSYHFFYVHPGVSISSDEANPRSFVHRLAPSLGSAPAALGLNVLRPIGFMDSMKGLGIATNDVAMIRYWNNEHLGNYGVYDIRFLRGVPPEVVRRAAADLEETFALRVRPQLPAHLTVPCSCSIEPVPHGRDTVPQLYSSKTLSEERILASTPLMPYRLVRRIRKSGGFITLIRSGPFVLKPALVQQRSRPLSAAELALLFTFERRLKTNRLLLSLSEFDNKLIDSA